MLRVDLREAEGRGERARRRGPAPRLRSGRPEQESKGASDRAGVWGGAPRELGAGDVITGVDEEDFASYAT
jgi:hypothetical protein